VRRPGNDGYVGWFVFAERFVLIGPFAERVRVE
jgi:hypothetical protein